LSVVSFPAHFLDHVGGLPGYDLVEFEQAHRQIPPTSIRLNPFKPVDIFIDSTPIPWSRSGRYLPARPSFTFDPVFHAGAYYVQEASSQLLEQVVLQHLASTGSLRVLDLCAAPGGKSTHLLSLIGDAGLLVSNEVIRSRSGILADNLDKWGCANSIVTQEDPTVIGKLSGFFDLMVVDAPCSGSGLFRKDPDAMGHWSNSAVEHCAARQKRILSDSWSALKEDGILVYSTCSFSELENEQMVNWILEELGGEFLPLTLPDGWGITTTAAGYRCWPHRLQGEGFFLAAIRKVSAASMAGGRTKSLPQRVVGDVRTRLNDWWKFDDGAVFDWKGGLWGFPAALASDLEWLCAHCQPLRVGTRLGEWVKEDLIPDHALALSRSVSSMWPRLELELDESIRYLQRGAVEREGLQRGWMLVTHRSLPVGWIKSLGNRINNYYPAHLRILKQSPGSGAEKNPQL